MIYTDLTKKVLKYVHKMHEGQFDKGGLPYFLHPFEVASKMKTEEDAIVALLHDVPEDCDDFSYDALIEYIQPYALSSEMLDALYLLTHRRWEPYMQYIEKLSHNKIARRVKLADLSHNADLSRLSEVTEKDIRRQRKYFDAMLFLMDFDVRIGEWVKLDFVEGDIYKVLGFSVSDPYDQACEIQLLDGANGNTDVFHIYTQDHRKQIHKVERD